MSRVQERIQENERQLTLDRQSLAHMENSSWRHMDDLHCALGGVTDQGPSLFRAHNKANEVVAARDLKVGAKMPTRRSLGWKRGLSGECR